MSTGRSAAGRGDRVRRTRKVWGVAAAFSLGWLGAGCVDIPGLAEQQAELAREHRARMDRLEEVEARLLKAEALRAEWAELRARHGRVSELACENATEHAQAIARHDQKEREKRYRSRERRVAAVTPAKDVARTGTASRTEALHAQADSGAAHGDDRGGAAIPAAASVVEKRAASGEGASTAN